jgi:hypothetical protein
MIKWSPALEANCRRRSISIGAEAVPRRVYKSLGVARGPVSSMRNLLDKSSVAQSLDGDRLTGSLRTPAGKLLPDRKDRKHRLPHPSRSEASGPTLLQEH